MSHYSHTFRYCATWAKNGECQVNPGWMLKNCPVACKECDNTCADHEPYCAKWKKNKECKRNPEYMNIYCARHVHIFRILKGNSEIRQVCFVCLSGRKEGIPRSILPHISRLASLIQAVRIRDWTCAQANSLTSYASLILPPQ